MLHHTRCYDQMSASTALGPLGPLVRMRALSPAELPSHPLLAKHQSAPVPPTKFIADVLDEAHTFVTSYWPQHFTVKSKTKQSSPSTALVEILAHEIPQRQLARHSTNSEAWFARTSLHENAAKAGTASWEEFDAGLRQDHSIHETDYTPDCIDAHTVLSWDDQTLGEVEGWGEVHVNVMEMCHQLPFPLNKRVFSVIVVTGKRNDEFVVVQIPVDLKDVPGTKYRGDSKFTSGMYVSVERGALADGGAKVKWQMGTASDAGGVLPMPVQKLGIPGAVVKDVGLFMDWCEKRRKGNAQ